MELGWHSYLQSKMISFESMEAKLKCVSLINVHQLAELSEPELKRHGRNSITAIAPTTSSAFILGQVSQSINQFGQYYVKELKTKLIRNPYLNLS